MTGTPNELFYHSNITPASEGYHCNFNAVLLDTVVVASRECITGRDSVAVITGMETGSRAERTKR